jgi:hypothetical protein
VAMQRYAEFRVLSARVHRPGDQPLRVTGHRHTFQYTPRPGYLYVRARMISSRTNDNHDTFPAEEIKRGWRTFIGKPAFVNHHNEDPRRARGVIIDAALHEDINPDGTPDTWVEGLHEIDAVRFPRLAKAILDGEIDRTSMGCNVEHSICSFCGNKARTPLEYCAHIQRMKGQRIIRTTASGQKEAVLVSEICYGLGFFENSLLVEPPADPTAMVVGVDSRGIDTPALGATADRRAADTGVREMKVGTLPERSRRAPGLRPTTRTASLQTEAAPKYPNPGDHPYFQKVPVHPDNIVAHWDRATPEEKDLGKRWYSDAHFVAKSMGKAAWPNATEAEAAHRGAGVLARWRSRPSGSSTASRTPTYSKARRSATSRT